MSESEREKKKIELLEPGSHELEIAKLHQLELNPHSPKPYKESEREKKKIELLEPGLHELEIVRMTATSLTPARVDRW